MAATLKRSLLVATLDSLETPHYLSPAITSAAAATTDSLVIVLLSPLFDLVSRTQQWDDVQRILAHVYVQATKVAQDNGRILMDVSVLLRESFPPHLAAEADQCFVLEGLENLPIRNLPPSVLPRGDRVSHPPPVRPPPEKDTPPLYPVVAVGGTFDHLHAGHKILLSMAAWITEKKLIIGVTGMGHSFVAYHDNAKLHQTTFSCRRKPTAISWNPSKCGWRRHAPSCSCSGRISSMTSLL